MAGLDRTATLERRLAAGDAAVQGDAPAVLIRGETGTGKELVARAAQLGYHALAITDECSLSGVVRAHTEAKRCGLHLIIGSEMQLTLPSTKAAATPADANAPGERHARLVLLAQTRRGYGNLSQWITVARRRAAQSLDERLVLSAHSGAP